MKLLIFIVFFLLVTNIVYSQPPVVDPSFRDNLINNKNELYQQMMQAEMRITANQEEYNITYYSLDLRPNPATSILTGGVEIVGKAIGTNLDYIELNFWKGMKRSFP